MRDLKQGTAANIMVLMVDAADHVAGKTGLTLTVTASKDGGAFASIAPAVTERGNGWYSLALTASHTDTLGDLALHVTAAGADPGDVLCNVTARSIDDVLPAASYTAPDNAAVTAIKAKTDALPASPAAAGEYTADLAGIAIGVLGVPTDAENAAAILAAAQSAPIHARVKIINDTVLAGAGTTVDPMRPA